MAVQRPPPGGDGAVVRRTNYGSEKPRFATGCCGKNAGVMKTPVRREVESSAQTGMSVPPGEAGSREEQAGRIPFSGEPGISVWQQVGPVPPASFRFSAGKCGRWNRPYGRLPALANKHIPSLAKGEPMSPSASALGAAPAQQTKKSGRLQGTAHSNCIRSTRTD